MRKHILAGVIVGGLFGVITAWIAMSPAWAAGGVVALAGLADGVMAGLGMGWLIGINVAEGVVYETEEELAPMTEPGKMLTAH